MIKLFNGDCLENLKLLDDNSVDSIVSDPPYGLSFMNKKWDYDVPSVKIWKECIRVLKPGGYMLAFAGSRTYHVMAMRIENAGFEIRDQIQWLYGSGFPKSHNLKEEWLGWGTALKPANEPIVLARKPLEKGMTVAKNVLKWGCGALNIDGCRIGTETRINQPASSLGNGQTMGGGKANPKQTSSESIGRWPANIIFDEEAAQVLDAQSGPCKTGDLNGQPRVENKIYGSAANTLGAPRFYKSDAATGASRFFYVAKASKSERNRGLEGMPEKESGIKNDSGRGFSESDPYKKITNQNFHPTVKPIKLMEYLVKLVTPPQGIVLDPFMGSGSTGVACNNLGFNFVGMELSSDYFEIAKKRIESTDKKPKTITRKKPK